jgi:DNA-directed RNA polymerase specialized sigma24 family protein
MKKNWELSQAQFDTLLNWLSEDREKAGEKYEEIRNSLVRLFELKGCNDSQTLADETINRLTSKIHTLELKDTVKPTALFFGFAKNVYLENLRKKENQFEPEFQKYAIKTSFEENSSNDYLDYLKECLNNRPPDERELILAYYEKDKSEKLEQRRKLAEKLKIEKGAMHTRIHRIRLSLQKCIERKINL